jgi:hypothetical protein
MPPRSLLAAAALPLLALLAAPAPAAAQAGPWDAARHLLPPSRVAEFDARCLDGSPPGYYIRRAATPTTKWKIHAQGGGWCTSPADCASRALSLLGSSTTWPPWLSTFWTPGEGAGFYGLMDANATNPFGGYNFVWLAYCDGSSQVSDLTDPLVVGAQTIFLRGRAILDANLAELEAEEGFLSTATEVIFSGTSAGGVSTYLHPSVVRSRLTAPGGARIVAMPDAGFFLDHGVMAPPHAHQWLATLTEAYKMWNATLRGDAADCAAAFAAEPAKCLFPQYLHAFSTVPTFILQSFMDTANLGICFSAECDPYTNCSPAQTEQILAYGADIVSNVTAAVALHGDRDGMFLTSCYQHEESCRAADWYGIHINGESANSSFFAWFTSGGSDPRARRTDVVWPGDATCTPQGVNHGAC